VCLVFLAYFAITGKQWYAAASRSFTVLAYTC
jgi:hypothetical protein